jgi:hypothetical protein
MHICQTVKRDVICKETYYICAQISSQEWLARVTHQRTEAVGLFWMYIRSILGLLIDSRSLLAVY